MLSFGKTVLALLLATFMSMPARADWREARTAHFDLYVDDTEDVARAFATKLERFDAALRLLYDVPEKPDQRPIIIYAMHDELFARTCGCVGVLGFYNPAAAGSFIMTFYDPKFDKKAKIGDLGSQAVLLHEYSHHFMFSNFPIAYPYWFTEGFAEFNANSTFEPNGSVIIGYPANYRGESLLSGVNLPMKKLLDPQQYGFVRNVDLIYGRGWLLTHYLMLGSTHAGQLDKYINAMNKGASSLDAAQQAFGDLKKLGVELDTYKHGKLFAPLRVPPSKSPPRVTVETLSPGRAELLPIYMLFTRGVDVHYRLGSALRAERVAKKYPDDVVVLTELAAIERSADRLDKADAAANAALAREAGRVDALVEKGSVAVARASETKATDPKIWSAARQWFLKANHADPNAVMPLYLFYQSFVAAHAQPTPGAVKALQRAGVLAPESRQVGFALARQFLNDGDAPSARALLGPLAFAPHRPVDKNPQLDAIKMIDAGKIDDAKAVLAKAAGDDKESNDADHKGRIGWVSQRRTSAFGNPDHTSS